MNLSKQIDNDAVLLGDLHLNQGEWLEFDKKIADLNQISSCMELKSIEIYNISILNWKKTNTSDKQKKSTGSPIFIIKCLNCTISTLGPSIQPPCMLLPFWCIIFSILQTRISLSKQLWKIPRCSILLIQARTLSLPTTVADRARW